MRIAAIFISLFVAAGCGPQLALDVETVTVQLVAQDRTWDATYLVSSDTQTTRLLTGREVHVPLNADVYLNLGSRDYVSDFRLPELGLRDFAAPGLPGQIRFRAERAGRYLLRGEELCGLPHTDKDRGWLVIEDETAFRSWVAGRTSVGNL